MKLIDQVCTLEQAKRLKELGIVQGRSYAAWIKNLCYNDTEFHFEPVNYPGCSNEGYENFGKGCLQGYSAFTVAELGAMLPDYTPHLGNLEIGKCETDHITLKRHAKGWWNVSYWTWTGESKGGVWVPEQKSNHLHQAGTLSQAMATMLIYLLENNLVKVEDVNNRLKQ